MKILNTNATRILNRLIAKIDLNPKWLLNTKPIKGPIAEVSVTLHP